MIASLFSGVGGIELGLRAGGVHLPVGLFCELNPDAQKVLQHHFPGVPVHGNVATLSALPPGTTLVTAGAPCTDLSTIGRCAGIHGEASSLVFHVFRLVRACPTVQCVVLENVPNMLRLHKGEAIRTITQELENLGFAWAYRTFNACDVGLPQWRQRVVIVARRDGGPLGFLFAPLARGEADNPKVCAGFYINEGKHSAGFHLGLAPTLKSNGNGGAAGPRNGFNPHCLILADGVRADGARLVHLHVEDAELAQGLPVGWTAPAGTDTRRLARIGNAVPVPLFALVGRGLTTDASPLPPKDKNRKKWRGSWPEAAHGQPATAPVAVVVPPAAGKGTPRAGFSKLQESRPVSARAAAGFAARAAVGTPSMPDWALALVAAHAERHADPALELEN